MNYLERTPEELEQIRLRELQEFADAAVRAEERKAAARAAAGEHTEGAEPTHLERHHEHHGNRRYHMNKNSSSHNDMPRTATDLLF